MLFYGVNGEITKQIAKRGQKDIERERKKEIAFGYLTNLNYFCNYKV